MTDQPDPTAEAERVKERLEDAGAVAGYGGYFADKIGERHGDDLELDLRFRGVMADERFSST